MALLRAGRHGAVSTWGIGQTASAEVTAGEVALERDVSAYLARMPFLWIDADDEPGRESIRSRLERNSIGLLSRATTIDLPSPAWLGRHAADERIRSSGLWNVKHVQEQYDPRFLDLFESLVLGSPLRNAPEQDTTPRSVEVPASTELELLNRPVLALVSCTKSKADRPCPAAELYQPSTFFSRAFALASATPRPSSS